MSDKPHTLFLVMGRTGAGKDCLINMLCERVGCKQLIPYTTRPRRDGEGDTHIFITDTEYKHMQQDGQIAAYTEIAGYQYCCTIQQLYESDLYTIDPIGVQNLRKLHLPDLRLVTVYINTPDNLREDRAINKRGDNKNQFRVRNYAEKKQFEDMLKAADFDYAVQNVRLPAAYSVLHWIYIAEQGQIYRKDITS